MMKSDLIRKERDRLAVLFEEVDDNKHELVEKLLDQAAFLSVENDCLQRVMETTGMVKVHPTHPEIQKPVEAARQYRQNVNTYAVIIKTLNGILTKDAVGEEDAFDEFIKQKQHERESRNKRD